MTHRAVGFGRGFPILWLLPIIALVVVLGFAVFGTLSRAVVADLIAWWPVWLVLGLAAVGLRHSKLGVLRVAGLVPLLALVAVAAFTWGHVAGWAIMPSASQRLVGPEVGEFESASLHAGIDGAISVVGGGRFLYQVEPVRRGGRIGIPDATEEIVDTSISIELEASRDGGLYSYAGWDLALASSPLWALSLDGAIDADLRRVRLADLVLDGAGEVDLGSVLEPVTVHVSGSFVITIPGRTPARVVGVASVPASWILTEDGGVAPPDGEGWLFEVDPDAALQIVNGDQ